MKTILFFIGGMTISTFLFSAQAPAASELALAGPWADQSSSALVDGNLVTDEPFRMIAPQVSWSTHICTGILIGADTVVTAQHCLRGRDRERIRITFFVSGKKDIIQGVSGITCRGGRWESRVDFNSMVAMEEENFDVCVLKLNNPVEEPIKPATLYTGPLAEGTELLHVGWGTPSEDGFPGSLRWGKTKFWFAKELTGYTHQDASTAKVCYGDSGGPLILKTAEGYQVVGLVTSTLAPCKASNFAIFKRASFLKTLP